MKKAILSLLFFYVFNFVVAQSVTLSQSVSPDLVSNGAAMCWSLTTLEDGWNDENYFARVYDLAGDHNINEDFLITAVELGQFYGNDKIIEVNIYETDNMNPNQGEKILLANEAIFVIPQANESILVVNTSALIPQGKKALIEIHTPAGIDEFGSLFFMGRNTEGQTRESWIKSAPCGFGSYLNPSQLGVGGQEYVINITGETSLSVRNNEAIQVNLFPNPVVNVLEISKPSTTQISNIKVVDLAGKVLLTSAWTDRLDVSGLLTGTYLVQFQMENGLFSKKIIKK